MFAPDTIAQATENHVSLILYQLNVVGYTGYSNGSKLWLVDDDFIGITKVGKDNKVSLGVMMLGKATFITILLVIQLQLKWSHCVSVCMAGKE